jgi:CBS-domain-containing membrane protein
MLEHTQAIQVATRLGVRRQVRPPEPAPKLSRNAPAVRVMTDFLVETALVVEPTRLIDEALEDMKRHGVRALLVVDSDELIGLVSAYDILGEKPVQFLQNPVCDHYPCTRVDVHVGNIMTPLSELPTLDWRWVEAATIADVQAAFVATAHMHLLVVQTSALDHGSVARGLFSRTRIERSLAGQLPPRT